MNAQDLDRLVVGRAEPVPQPEAIDSSPVGEVDEIEVSPERADKIAQFEDLIARVVMAAPTSGMLPPQGETRGALPTTL